ncbi:phage holin family protein [Pararhodobacter oceanensis]|uniref:phage holin family protein n=1 Tax=Pararhodobacter oceanensis TaxID=2172121 RepID=UPI003A9037D5
MFSLQDKLQRAARKGAAFSAAGLLAVVGGAFLTSAAWMLLAQLETQLFAATVIGCVYLGGAAIALAIGLKKPATPEPLPAERSELSPLQAVVLSFIQGFEQGRKRQPPR